MFLGIAKLKLNHSMLKYECSADHDSLSSLLLAGIM